MIENEHTSFVRKTSNAGLENKGKDKDITLNRFDFIFKNRINPSLDEDE